MAKDLKSLIRLHKWIVDEKRRQLGELLRMLHDLEERARHLEDELAREQKIARAAPEVAGFLYGNYAEAVIQRRERLKMSIASSETAVEAARQALNEAYRDLKKYEVAQAVRERRQAEQLARREQITLDDVGIESFRQKKRRAGR
jgi:flagellar export protein FliJ